MYEKLYLLIVIILLSHEIVHGKNGTHTKNIKNNHKNFEKNNERSKRSLGEFEKSFLAHVRPELEEDGAHELAKYASNGRVRNEDQKNLENDSPFWGTRGRRDSSSESTEYINTEKEENKNKKCKNCKHDEDFYSNKIREELDPFWFERGVKSFDEVDEFNPFWGNRGRRSEIKWRIQNEDPPFWGNRGRRDEMEPFWGNRGRRDETEPFWGNRGRRDEMEPFWGNRGRRQDNEPFWGTRGRRETENYLPGRNAKNKENDHWTVKNIDSYWGNQDRKKNALKENIINAMENVEYGVESLSRMRRAEGSSFWSNRGRESKLEKLFRDPAKNRLPLQSNGFFNKFGHKPFQQNTVLDERMYAEQPHYILIERSSRSSAEDDPFFISRGKKYFTSKLRNGMRGRRGILEELVKSVRNDPYYIARGKKDSVSIKIGNSTILKDEFVKAKELICSAVDLLVIKNDGHKVKRDIDESERERRTILKKLAAQLQMDPYFVSRGKRDEIETNEEHLEEFVNRITNMCN